MTDIHRSLRELRELDALSLEASPLRRFHPGAKLFLTVAYILFVVSYQKYQLSGMAAMALIPVILFQIRGLSITGCFSRMKAVMPIILAVGIVNPFLDRKSLFCIASFTVTGGMISMITLALKGVLTLMMGFLLISCTTIDELCSVLRKMHIPPVIVTLVLLTYRYIFVMAEEVSIMTDAYMLRAPGQRGIHYRVWGSFLGQLLLRSMDKAQNLFMSMQLRGFKGEFYYADIKQMKRRDWVASIVGLLLLIILRRYNVTELLGSFWMR